MTPEEKNPEVIRQRMDALRHSLKDDVALVASSVRTKSDWRYYVQNHPWLSAGAAAAVGYLLVPRHNDVPERIVPDSDALREIADQEKIVLAPEEKVTPGKGVAASLLAFALAAGSRAAMGYFSNKLGGVIEQVTNTGSRDGNDYPYATAEKKPK